MREGRIAAELDRQTRTPRPIVAASVQEARA